MVLLAGIALVVLGPDRLPGYAAQAARMMRQVRTMADNVKDHAREQMGPEFDDIDWESLDPRQYDPRRVIRDAIHREGDANAATGGQPLRPQLADHRRARVPGQVKALGAWVTNTTRTLPNHLRDHFRCDLR